jgi:serine/threonine-protein kinase RsbW/stage II sporulation protein AB (anti-sigma F factor)
VTLADAPEPVELRLPAKPESVAVARHAASSYAEDVGADPHAVAVAVSEIVTNAIMHAYREREAGTVEVSADLNTTHMVIVVTDRGRGMGPNPDSPGLGFGLSMVSSLADEIGIDSSKGGGTRLWMRFPLD